MNATIETIVADAANDDWLISDPDERDVELTKRLMKYTYYVDNKMYFDWDAIRKARKS